MEQFATCHQTFKLLTVKSGLFMEQRDKCMTSHVCACPIYVFTGYVFYFSHNF